MAVAPSVFISYSSKDVKIAEAIEDNLIKKGFKVWRDKSEIERDWSREIANALSESDIVLLVWTTNTKESKMVKQEWLTARALSKVIQIAVVNTESPIELPEPLINL